MSNSIRVLGAMILLALGAATEAAAQRTPEARARAERESRAAATARARAEAATRGWIGITYTTSETGGAMVVTQVVRGSPAEAAGLRRGDTIVRWNGSRNPTEEALRHRLQPGDTVRLHVVGSEGEREREVTVVAEPARGRAVTVLRDRGGDVVVLRPSEVLEGVRIHMDSLGIDADSLHTRLRVMLRDSLGPALERFEAEELPRLQAELERVQARMAHGFSTGVRSVAGAEFAELNSGLASYFGTERGALVLRVAPETPAARSGLQAGDVVVSANGHAIDDVRDLREAVTRSRDRDVELEIVRRGARSQLRLHWD